MAGGEGVELVEVEMEDIEGVVGDCERLFVVGELVEFWAGPVVRAYRTDSGDPAYVKEIYGLGWYGIKMVGSFRGRNRRVFWRSLFKDSSFQKQVMSAGGVRVRTKARMQERAIDKAEAKFGEELRATKRQLEKNKQEAQDRLKEQDREARKAEKELTVLHKRQLTEMRGDLDRTREEDVQIHQEFIRQGRVKARQITKQLEETKQHLFENKETNDGLVKAVSKGTAKIESLREDGLRWKAKYMAATEDVRVKTRQIAQELDETKRHLLATQDTHEGLVKAVSNGITKWERVREDRLRWKTKYLAGLEDVRVRGNNWHSQSKQSET